MIFEEEIIPDDEIITRLFELGSFNESILRKALSKLDFYKFNNLKKYFPELNSINEFIESLKQINVDVRSSKERLNNLTPDDKLEVCLSVLKPIRITDKSRQKVGGKSLGATSE